MKWYRKDKPTSSRRESYENWQDVGIIIEVLRLGVIYAEYWRKKWRVEPTLWGKTLLKMTTDGYLTKSRYSKRQRHTLFYVTEKGKEYLSRIAIERHSNRRIPTIPIGVREESPKSRRDAKRFTNPSPEEFS